ncbi:hypothetical protein ASE16_15425 [Leifsonia sp. Root227]|uniref:hypothetical protein n=1 Tax=Leifsonia sp. Root227 TaxID=1736496 RepID=UPI0006F40EA1|nr:hypothetical protein [Leifsonia sp. Root227]KRC46796.1 hypothetical protein ASE16_15425 [Leifsonia sp. Root227]
MSPAPARTASAGLATTGARVALIVVWLTGVAQAVLGGWFPDSGGAIGVVGFLLPLAGAVLVTSPAPGPLPRRRALIVLAGLLVVAVSVLLFLELADPSAGEVWLFNVNSYLAALLIMRGNVVIGGIGTVAVVAFALAWGVYSGRLGVDLAELVLPAVSAAIVGATWRFVLAAVVRREHSARERAALADAEARAAEDATRASRAELAEILRIARPSLNDLAAGRTIDDGFLRQLTVAEGGIRDRIRAAGLAHPALAEAVDAARRGGARVLMLGGEDPSGAVISDTLAGALAELVAQTVDITIQARGRGVVSVLMRPEGGPAVRVLLDAEGQPANGQTSGT